MWSDRRRHTMSTASTAIAKSLGNIAQIQVGDAQGGFLRLACGSAVPARPKPRAQGNKHSWVFSSPPSQALRKPTDMDGERHWIVIPKEGGDFRRHVTVSRFQSGSRKIHSLIQRDIRQNREETRLEARSPLTPGTLERLVLCIDDSGPIPRLDFRRVLLLSIAIWDYHCNPTIFIGATAALENPTPSDLGDSAAGWMFIALIFGWRDEFQQASIELISRFDSPMDVIRYGLPYFPVELASKHFCIKQRSNN